MDEFRQIFKQVRASPTSACIAPQTHASDSAHLCVKHSCGARSPTRVQEALGKLVEERVDAVARQLFEAAFSLRRGQPHTHAPMDFR